MGASPARSALTLVLRRRARGPRTGDLFAGHAQEPSLHPGRAARADRQAVLRHVNNLDDTADEFEMQAPAVEKVIPPGDKGKVRHSPARPGPLPFSGEFHADTAKGVFVSE